MILLYQRRTAVLQTPAQGRTATGYIVTSQEQKLFHQQGYAVPEKLAALLAV